METRVPEIRINFDNDECLLPLKLDSIENTLKSATDEIVLDRADTNKENIWELEDMLQMYPDQNMPGIQTYTTSKAEFKQYSAPESEKIPETGDFFSYQKLFHIYGGKYDKILNIQRAGTGKTGSAGGLAEFIKRNLKFNDLFDFVQKYNDNRRSNIKRCVILVPSKLLKNNFRNQLVYIYGKNDYDVDAINNLQTSNKTRFITNLLSKFYYIETYTTFSNEINTLANGVSLEEFEQRIIDKYSDTLFIVDESHNLRIETGEGVEIGKQKSDKRQQAIIYQNIHKVFHTALRTKIVLMTATPMINSSIEMIDQLNLILDEYSQIEKDYDRFKSASLNDMEPYYRGKITYIRENMNIIREVKGDYIYVDEINKIKLSYDINGKKYYNNKKIIQLNMINYEDANGNPSGQRSVYAQACVNLNVEELDQMMNQIDEQDLINEVLSEEKNENTADTTEDLPNVKKNNFFKKAGILRQISNAIFPDGSYGNEGFKKYIKESESGIFKANDELHSYIETRLDFLSVKFNYLANLLEEDISQFEKNKLKRDKLRKGMPLTTDEINIKDKIFGPMYTYTHFKTGSGAYYMGLCLEQRKLKDDGSEYIQFERFMGKTSPFKAFQQSDKLDVVCGLNSEDENCTDEDIDKSENKYQINSTFAKKWRYAILTSGLSSEEIDNIINLYSCPENIDGEYLKLLIITPIGKEGINLSNTMDFILLEPSWNPSSEYQATSRGFREKSHVEKIKQFNQLLEDQKLKLGDTNEKLKVGIYNLAAVTSDYRPIDLDLYTLSEQKDIDIKIEMRYAKQSAFDGYLHKDRNQRIEDTDFSTECDYDICEYTMHDPEPPPNYVDYSNYDILYSDDITNKVINSIKLIFKNYYNIESKKLIKLLNGKGHRSKIILRALNKIINGRIMLYNRVGQRCYLLEDNNILFTHTEFPIKENLMNVNKYNLSYYNKNLIAVDSISLTEYLSNDQNVLQSSILNSIWNISNLENFNQIFNNLTYTNKIKIFEEVLQKEINGIQVSPIMQSIKNKFINSWMILPEPLLEIQESSIKLSQEKNTVKKPGRKPNIKPNEKIDIVKSSPYKNSLNILDKVENVYIHILYGDLEQKSSISVVPHFKNANGHIRIYKKSTGTWRDTNSYEIEVYRKYFVEKRRKDIRDSVGIKGTTSYNPITATILSDGELRLTDNDKTPENVNGQNDQKGKKISLYQKHELVTFMYKLGIRVDIMQNQTIITDQILEFLSKTFTVNQLANDQILYYYRLLSSHLGKEDLVDYIVARLKELNLIWYLFH